MEAGPCVQAGPSVQAGCRLRLAKQLLFVLGAGEPQDRRDSLPAALLPPGEPSPPREGEMTLSWDNLARFSFACSHSQ